MNVNKTINFLRSLQKENGAFRGWPEGPEYPEITGYLIPTLLQWGEVEMAEKAADYLISSQNEDGSWNGVDGIPAAFDSAACVEGLQIMMRLETADAAERGRSWIKTQKLDQLYHIRVNGILGLDVDYGIEKISDLRMHYFAYALEGFYLLGNHDFVLEELEELSRGQQPYTLDGRESDTCATAQIAKLRLLLGMDAGEEIRCLRGLVNHDGSLPHDLTNKKKVAWACKYYLDVEWLVKEKGMDTDWWKVKEWEFQAYNIDMDKWKKWLDKPVGISGCFRVRNDHEFLYEAVASHIPYLDEAVIALQPSNKETHQVIKKLLKDFPEKVRVVNYPVAPVFITDPSWETVPENSIMSFVYLSNWALSQCKYSWIARIEADVICCSSFQKIVDRVRENDAISCLYGRVILNVAGENMDQISATNPRNGGWDECVFPNNQEYHFTKRPKYEVLESPWDDVCMGWSALHMKRCKSDKIGWNNETYVPFTPESVATALREFNKNNPYPGLDNPEGESVLFNTLW